MIYIIGDTHFGHSLLEGLEYRGEGFEERIIKNWNQVVKPGDKVIHLGDFSLGRYKGASANKSITIWREKLNGEIILIRGNHDHNPCEWYMKNGFSFCADSIGMDYRGKKLIFTHEPTQLFEVGQMNIHGHLHGNSHRLEGDLAWYNPGDPHYLDVSVECIDYKPLSLDSL